MRNNLLKLTREEWFRPFPPKYVFKEERKNASELNNNFKRYMKNTDNIKFFDPINEISCCKNIKEFEVFFRKGDSNHLSDYGATVLIKKIMPLISSIK